MRCIVRFLFRHKKYLALAALFYENNKICTRRLLDVLGLIISNFLV